MFLAAILLLSIGFQVHVFINGERIFANVGRPNDVSDLLSLFWIAFSLAMLPASALTKRFGGAGGTYCADRRTLRAWLSIDGSFVLGARPLLAGGGADGASSRSKAGGEKWALTWWTRPPGSVDFWYD
jgi:hypothetical protein